MILHLILTKFWVFKHHKNRPRFEMTLFLGYLCNLPAIPSILAGNISEIIATQGNMNQAVSEITREKKKTAYPSAPLTDLDTLWFQVSGTICNLACTHCFISCSPTNHSHEMLSLETVKQYLAEARQIGVKEYYFTGGEPFLNREMVPILEETLKQGPASVLTNGLLITPKLAATLKKLSENTPYSLDIRISIDGWDAQTNDSVRGKGTFAKILKGIGNLVDVNLIPVITVSEACEGAGTNQGRIRFLEILKEIGLERPRLKILPLIRLGAETKRTRGYQKWESMLGRELNPDEAELLQCSTCRMVSSKGVYVCPILLDFPKAKMGDNLKETLRPFELKYSACHTCWEMGLSCST